MPFDTHAAVKTLTAHGAQPELAKEFVTVAQDAHGDDDLVTRADLTAAVAGLDAWRASMETRLTWRFVGAVAAGFVLVFMLLLGPGVANGQSFYEPGIELAGAVIAETRHAIQILKADNSACKDQDSVIDEAKLLYPYLLPSSEPGARMQALHMVLDLFK